MNQPSGKIVQIGAVVGDTMTGSVTNRLKIYINPGEPIAPFITELCGITQAQIDREGIPLDAAYTILKDFHVKHSTFMNPLTWGGADSQELFDQLDPEIRKDWCFGRRWIDAKTVFVSRMIAKQDRIESGGLSSSMSKLNLKFQGRKHDAQDDAENTFKVYYHMLQLIRQGDF